MTGADLYIFALLCYGAGIFSAIGAMFAGRSIGRRQVEVDRYWQMSWEERENITETCHRLRVPPPSKL